MIDLNDSKIIHQKAQSKNTKAIDEKEIEKTTLDQLNFSYDKSQEKLRG